MAFRISTIVLLVALLSIANASDLGGILIVNTERLVTQSSKVLPVLKRVDETNIAETGRQVSTLLAKVADAYIDATADLSDLPKPEGSELSEADVAAIEANLSALVLTQKDISAELIKKVDLFVKNYRSEQILLVLEDLREVALKTYVPELQRFLEQPSKVLKGELEDLLTKAIKAYTPARAAVQ